MKCSTRSAVHLAAGLIAALAPSAFADTKGPEADAFYEAVKGEWQGTLEYRDYSNDKRVTLPTTLEARPSKDGASVAFRFRFDEGRGRFVESSETIRIDPVAGRYVVEGEGEKDRNEYAVSGLPEFAAKRQGDLVLTGTGEENGQKVDVRKTITVLDGRFAMLKETRLPGKPFQFRNQYTFRRPAKKPSPAPAPNAGTPLCVPDRGGAGNAPGRLQAGKLLSRRDQIG